MRFIKKNLILSFCIFILILSVAFAALGFYSAEKVQSTQKILDSLTWSLEPSEKYDWIYPAEQDGQFIANYTDRRQSDLIDYNGTVISKLPGNEAFGNNLYEYEKDGFYGVSDIDGNIIVKAKYDYIVPEGNYLIGYNEENYPTILDLTGKQIYAAKQEQEITSITDDKFLIIDTLSDKHEVLNAKTMERQEISKEIIWMTGNENGGYIADYEGFTRILDKNYELVKDAPIYESYHELSEGLRYVCIYDEETSERTAAYIDQHGEIIINFGSNIPHTAGPFSEGKALIQLDNELVCIDKTGAELFKLDVKRSNSSFQIYDTFVFSEGLAAVTLDGEKYGYIDENGEFVIPAILFSADEIKNGYAAASIYRNAFQYGILKFD